METIDIRRSVRNFSDKAVNDEQITKILRAAMQAPSAGNQRPWEFIVVRDKDTLAELAKTSPYAGSVAHCQVAIIILGDGKKLRFPGHVEQDLGACVTNALLETVNLGLGSVWLGMSPEKDRMAKISTIFNLGDDIIPYAILPIGFPLNEDANTFVDRFEADRIHYEKY